MITLHWSLFLLACSVSIALGYFIYALMYRASVDDTSQTTKQNTDDYIDWSRVPEGYDWVSRGNPDCGYTFGVYACKELPVIINRNYDGEEDWGGVYEWHNIQHAIIGPLPPWRESLRKRPGK